MGQLGASLPASMPASPSWVVDGFFDEGQPARASRMATTTRRIRRLSGHQAACHDTRPAHSTVEPAPRDSRCDRQREATTCPPIANPVSVSIMIRAVVRSLIVVCVLAGVSAAENPVTAPAPPAAAAAPAAKATHHKKHRVKKARKAKRKHRKHKTEVRSGALAAAFRAWRDAFRKANR